MDKKLKYEVDYEKKQITCTATNCSRDVLDMFSKKSVEFPEYMRHMIFNDAFQDFFIIPETISATVTCSETDYFDEEIGKKIACAKMRKKYHKIINKKFKDYRNQMNYFIEFFIEQQWKSHAIYSESEEVFDILSHS